VNLVMTSIADRGKDALPHTWDRHQVAQRME